MAPLQRYTWMTLKAEVIRRLGGRTEPGFSSRVEYWIDAAQLDLGCTIHHFELDKTDQALTLGAGSSTINLPADCYIVMGVGLRNAGAGTFRKWLLLNHLRFVQANFSDAPNEPSEYARFGDQLQFNCTSDGSYPLLLRYYKYPSAPDFGAGAGPEFSRLWDEHLVEGAIAKANGSLWRPDLASAQTQTLQEFLASQVQPALLAEVFPDRPSQATANRTHGGAQG